MELKHRANLLRRSAIEFARADERLRTAADGEVDQAAEDYAILREDHQRAIAAYEREWKAAKRGHR